MHASLMGYRDRDNDDDVQTLPSIHFSTKKNVDIVAIVNNDMKFGKAEQSNYLLVYTE
jgi:hypothetical protein